VPAQGIAAGHAFLVELDDQRVEVGRLAGHADDPRLEGFAVTIDLGESQHRLHHAVVRIGVLLQDIDVGDAMLDVEAFDDLGEGLAFLLQARLLAGQRLVLGAQFRSHAQGLFARGSLSRQSLLAGLEPPASSGDRTCRQKRSDHDPAHPRNHRYFLSRSRGHGLPQLIQHTTLIGRGRGRP
jgi:hypothetical protein